jgi:Na+-translocating ferredoxin:NAD+ oxidoreductase RnfG subunit
LAALLDGVSLDTTFHIGDLLGIKVIKLNKINETPTIGVQICSPLKTWREPSFQSSKLPATNSNQNLISNPAPKNRRRLDA